MSAGDGAGHSSLRYIDFICAATSVEQVLVALQQELSLDISMLIPPEDQSGPKELEAISTFSRDRADFGRI